MARPATPLTDTKIRNAKPKDKPYKLTDGGGLFLFVTPTGRKWWRLKYLIEGKEKLLSLGVYPAVGLKEAREKRDDARKVISQGIDPSAQRQAAQKAIKAETANAFEAIALEWHAKTIAKWTEGHAEKILSRLKRDVFPIIGGIPINEITPPMLLDTIRKIEQRGIHETARKALQSCGQIFRYAIATGRAERNPAADLKGALESSTREHYASITEPGKIGTLLRDLDAYTGFISVRAALRMMPYVFTRNSELRCAEWSEFNLEAQEWRIPAERMKVKQPHIVPLARQVLEILADLHQYTGTSRYLFPSVSNATTPISNMALLSALRRMGYTKEEMTVHGFRSMASTLLNERGYNWDWIERQLAHGERNTVRAAYNYADYLPDRRRMMQEWADYLDGLRAQS